MNLKQPIPVISIGSKANASSSFGTSVVWSAADVVAWCSARGVSSCDDSERTRRYVIIIYTVCILLIMLQHHNICKEAAIRVLTSCDVHIATQLMLVVLHESIKVFIIWWLKPIIVWSHCILDQWPTFYSMQNCGWAQLIRFTLSLGRLRKFTHS